LFYTALRQGPFFKGAIWKYRFLNHLFYQEEENSIIWNMNDHLVGSSIIYAI
jgi:hypothetical protein